MAIDLPPPVPGNPGAMRALAGQLRTIAEGAGGAIASVETAAGGLDFKGPAATRLHAAISAFGARGRGAASELHDLSDLLLRSAAEVEAAQAERARLERLIADAAAKAGVN